MGTMTEPDCLGPLDPGTSVTLEGIVWQETDGGERRFISFKTGVVVFFHPGQNFDAFFSFFVAQESW